MLGIYVQAPGSVFTGKYKHTTLVVIRVAYNRGFDAYFEFVNHTPTKSHARRRVNRYCENVAF